MDFYHGGSGRKLGFKLGTDNGQISLLNLGSGGHICRLDIVSNEGGFMTHGSVDLMETGEGQTRAVMIGGVRGKDVKLI